VPLTALLILDDSDHAFTVLGVPMVEFQIRQARSQGVSHVVIMVGRLPPALLAGVDRLRREELGVDVARTVSDAIDFVHPDDRVLLIAPRLFVAAKDVRKLVQASGPAVLATATSAETASLDIIDGGRRWTGWAAFEGAFLRDVGSTIGDWDLAPTILRQLLQRHAHVAMAEAAPAMLDKSSDRHRFERDLLANADPVPDGLGASLISRPAARLIARVASDAGIRSDWIKWGAMATGAGAVALALASMIAVPCVIMMVAFSGRRAAAVMAYAIGMTGGVRRATNIAWTVAIAVMFLAFGRTMMAQTGQWGCVVTAVGLAGALGLLRTPLARPRNPLTMADSESSLFLIGVAAIPGMALWGLAAAASHAVLSVAARQTSLKGA
jgi:hypothetical protein